MAVLTLRGRPLLETGVGEVGNGRGQATHSFRCDLVSTEDSFVLSFILFPLGLRGSCVQQKTSHG